MARISIDPDGVGIREVLAGLSFPAPRWAIVAHAQHWGASAGCIAELIQLPVRDYRDLRDVAGALGARRGAHVGRSTSTRIALASGQTATAITSARRSAGQFGSSAAARAVNP
ncbi:MAG: DUF2795 domain-containing protein [Pseudonocardia sp.]|jgi:hypothetical protein